MSPGIVSIQQQQALQIHSHQNAFLNGSQSMVGFNGVHNAIRSNIERNAMSSTSSGYARPADIACGPNVRAATYVNPLSWPVSHHRIAEAREEAGQAARADSSLSARVSRALAGCCNPFAANKD
jgi:hypothetical protein